MERSYICKIPTIQEMNQKWDLEIACAGSDRDNWVRWKEKHIAMFQTGKSIPYYGILDGVIVCEATACMDAGSIQNAAGLVGSDTVYLCAFRTLPEYRGQGWFSRLFRFLEADLVKRGFRYATLGVEPEETENLAIYTKYGFTQHIKQSVEFFPDGSRILVDYYRKELTD